MSGLKIEKLEKNHEIDKILQEEIYNEFCKSYVLLGEDSTCFPDNYIPYAYSVKNFEVYESDIWVASYPKAGTTWTQEMVWMILNDLDFEKAKTPLLARFPFFEESTLADLGALSKILNPNQCGSVKNSIEYVAKQADHPRFIKTHLPFSMLPDQIKEGSKTPKIVYVMRNPKDLCVSYYHHGNLVQMWRTKLENFAKIFMADRAHYGSYWKHIFGYWNNRDSLNILFIKYEDIKADLVGVIEKVAKFLGKTLTQEQTRLLSQHLSFESMKNNDSLNVETFVKMLRKHNFVHEDGHFIRAGIVGKYKEELSEETIEKFNEWIEKNVKGTSFEKEYDFDL